MSVVNYWKFEKFYGNRQIILCPSVIPMYLVLPKNEGNLNDVTHIIHSNIYMPIWYQNFN